MFHNLRVTVRFSGSSPRVGVHGPKEEALLRPLAVATRSYAALTAPDVDTPLLFFASRLP